MRRKKNSKRKLELTKMKLFLLCLVVFIMFIGIGRSIGEKLTSKATNGEEKLAENEEKLKLERKGKTEKEKEIKNNSEKEIKKEKHNEEKEETKKDTEVVEKDVQAKEIKEEEKPIDQEKEPSNDNKKVAYLTFDDGPSVVVTPQILDILDNCNVKATFFVIGSLAEQNSDLIKREYNSGHAIGNHTYSHNYKYIYGSVNNLLSDIDKCENVLKGILGDDFHSAAFRFPGGSFGEKKQPFKDVLKNKGIGYVDWNALNGDAEGHNIPKDRLVQRLVQTTQGKNKVVILMHDAGAKKTTAQALPDIINYLKNQGYEFETIDQEALNGF